MNKKRTMVIVMLGLFLILGVVLIVMGINLDKNSPPSGSFIKSYDYIQGDFNKDNLNEMSKAFLEKATINYGKETKISDDKKTVEAVIKVPDIVKIYEAAFDELKDKDKSDYMMLSESIKKIAQEKLAAGEFEVVENRTTLTMVKNGEKWYIVPDENFGNALAGNMVDFLKENVDYTK